MIRHRGEVSDKKYFFGAGKLFKYTSPAPGKPGMYLKTPFRRRRSIYTHFSGAGEVLIYTYLAPERPEKPEKYLYTPLCNSCLNCIAQSLKYLKIKCSTFP